MPETDQPAEAAAQSAAGSAPESAPESAPAEGSDAGPQVQVSAVARVRRAPRYRAFALAGAGLAAAIGVVSALVVAGVTGRDGDLGYVLVFTVVGAVLVGAIAGAVVAVLVDRRSLRPADGPSPRARARWTTPSRRVTP